MPPAISALLTTHNRAHLLPRVLGGLQKQTLAKAMFEIIAIDDGSVDDTPAVLASYADKLPLRIFRQGASGLAAAKNLGVFAARAPIIVFLDDDDVLDPDALRAHLAAHNANPDMATAVLAHSRLDPEVAKSPLMRHVTEVGCQLFSYNWVKRGGNLGYREFWGGRSSCKREFLLTHGVFNPAFRFGCEDIECGWRLRPHGLKVIYEPAASAAMIRSISFDDFCRRSYAQGRSQVRFAQIHPDPEIRAYCEIDDGLRLWQNCWRNYAAVLRRVRECDKMASDRILAGATLDADFQKQLDDGYFLAFALSRAKGVADALWLSETTPEAPRNKAYGLAGDFTELMRKLDAPESIRR